MLNIPSLLLFVAERGREGGRVHPSMEMEGEGSMKEKDKNSGILGGADVVREMVEMIEKMGSYSDFRKTQRKECLNLVRRLKLLTPLLEEIRELHPSISDHAFTHLVGLKKALLASKKLLKTCNSTSKIFLVS